MSGFINFLSSDNSLSNNYDFIFQPGGIQENNIYTNWSDLVVAAKLISSPKIIYFDDSFSAITIPSGVWDFGSDILNWQGVFYNTEITISDGATFSVTPNFKNVKILFSGTITPFTINNSRPFTFVEIINSDFICGGVAIFEILTIGARLCFSLNFSNILNSGGLFYNCLDNNISKEIFLCLVNLSTIESNVLSGVSGPQYILIVESLSINFSLSQSALPGGNIFIINATDASLLRYNDGVSSFVTFDVDNVQDAIDKIKELFVISKAINLFNLQTITVNSSQNGKLIYVETIKDIYQLDTDSVLAVDGINVTSTILGGNTRFIRKNLTNIYWTTQQNWYVDYFSGNDENNGNTSLTPIKTFKELTKRIGNIINLDIDMNIYVLSNTPEKLNIEVQSKGSNQLKIFGSVYIIDSTTLSSSSVVDYPTNTPGLYTFASSLATNSETYMLSFPTSSQYSAIVKSGIVSSLEYCNSFNNDGDNISGQALTGESVDMVEFTNLTVENAKGVTFINLRIISSELSEIKNCKFINSIIINQSYISYISHCNFIGCAIVSASKLNSTTTISGGTIISSIIGDKTVLDMDVHIKTLTVEMQNKNYGIELAFLTQDSVLSVSAGSILPIGVNTFSSNALYGSGGKIVLESSSTIILGTSSSCTLSHANNLEWPALSSNLAVEPDDLLLGLPITPIACTSFATVNAFPFFGFAINLKTGARITRLT